MNSQDQTCELCGCQAVLTKHHLVPVSRAKNKYKQLRNDESNFIWICRSCHDHIHATYGESELRDRLSTLDALKADEKIMSFVRWKAKHPDFKGHAKMSNERKARNRR